MTRSAPRPPASAPAHDGLATVLRACADPGRLTILRLLARDAFAVAELGTILGLGQATVSHHLKSLADAGLVSARRDGTHSFHRRTLPGEGPGSRLHAALLEEIDARPLDPQLLAGREQVFRARAQRSRAFFDRNADHFDASRDLIARPEAYLPELAELLPATGRRALEIGPGPGEFLPELARRFATVIALDASDEMVERARGHCSAAGLDHVRIHRGELPAARGPLADAGLAALLEAPLDVIVCAMVLHHTPGPDALIARCAERLAPGGQLLIAELCPHGQDWTLDACGDVWSGIDPDELTAWATAAGLDAGPSQFLAQRNGFRIQLRRFERPAAAETSTPESSNLETP
jgi:ArsR family transcriptional regulator